MTPTNYDWQADWERVQKALPKTQWDIPPTFPLTRVCQIGGFFIKVSFVTESEAELAFEDLCLIQEPGFTMKISSQGFWTPEFEYDRAQENPSFSCFDLTQEVKQLMVRFLWLMGYENDLQKFAEQFKISHHELLEWSLSEWENELLHKVKGQSRVTPELHEDVGLEGPIDFHELLAWSLSEQEEAESGNELSTGKLSKTSDEKIEF